MTLLASAAPTAVLDTNVVLDWLVFRNSDCDAIAGAITAGDLYWVATRAMRDELAHVLARGHLDAWAPDQDSIWGQWDRHCTEVPAPMSLAPPARLRCSDPDDQMFIDLAVACRVRWLLTRDRAVRKLALRLRAYGIHTIPPEHWEPTTRPLAE